MTPPFGKCVWCERADFTEEHIIGRQFAKAVGITFPVPTTWGRHKLPEGDGIVLNDRVCDTCNRNWMRRIDNKAMKALAPALRAPPQRIQLNQREQEIVSIWATKIALLLALRQIDLIEKYPVLAQNGDNAWVPDASFTAIGRNKRRPPDGATVQLGALAPNAGLPPVVESVASMGVLEPVDAPGLTLEDIARKRFQLPGKHVYVVSFCIGRLIVVATGREPGSPDGPPGGEAIDPFAGAPHGALRRIWPITERVVDWPPPRTLADIDAATPTIPSMP